MRAQAPTITAVRKTIPIQAGWFLRVNTGGTGAIVYQKEKTFWIHFQILFVVFDSDERRGKIRGWQINRDML